MRRFIICILTPNVQDNGIGGLHGTHRGKKIAFLTLFAEPYVAIQSTQWSTQENNTPMKHRDGPVPKKVLKKNPNNITT
jgi:hypothetical protein